MSNATYFSDSWLSGTKTAEKAISKGVDYCGLINKTHKGFFLAMLERLTKEWPGGYHIVIKSNLRVSDKIKLIAIGYKYNYCTFI